MKTWFYKKQIIRFYDKIAVLSVSEIEYFGLKNVVVIPNFINVSGRANSISAKKNIVITAGRIAPIKQFEHLVDIWSMISSKNLNWELHVYGNGNVEALQEKIKEKNLEESFKLFPVTREIRSKMEGAKIFVLVSKFEAFPMVLLEAMQAQLPIVSYDSPHGPKNIITDGEDGFIVPLNNKVIFAQKLNMLINTPQLRDEFVQKQKIKLNLFSKQKIMNQWNDLVCNLLSKN